MIGIFYCQQVCSATSRLLIHESIKEKFLARLLEETIKIKIGNGLMEDVTLGPIVNEGQYQKVVNYIESAKREGI
jgi:betaine-aldehyde dehydrogenase